MTAKLSSYIIGNLRGLKGNALVSLVLKVSMGIGGHLPSDNKSARLSPKP